MSGNPVEPVIPARAAGQADMRIRTLIERAVQTARRNQQHRAVHVQAGKRRPAPAAELLRVAGAGKPIPCHAILTGQPAQPGGCREQVGGMRRSGVLAATAAMAQEKMLERARNLKPDGPTQAASGMRLRH